MRDAAASSCHGSRMAYSCLHATTQLIAWWFAYKSLWLESHREEKAQCPATHCICSALSYGLQSPFPEAPAKRIQHSLSSATGWKVMMKDAYMYIYSRALCLPLPQPMGLCSSNKPCCTNNTQSVLVCRSPLGFMNQVRLVSTNAAAYGVTERQFLH